jgi:hypothetical protein
MDARLLVSSKWMVSEQFGIGDVPKEPVVTIADVKIEEQEGDKGKERWGILYFSEPYAKPLKVNRTHQKALILMFGGETNDWKGKKIGLRGVAGVYFGKRQTAVRIFGSPHISEPCSFSVKKFGGGSDVYDLKPIGQATPYERMWNAWKGAGQSEKDGAGFKAMIRSATGKGANDVTPEDVAKFTAALNGPPPVEKAAEPEPGSAG